MSLVFMLTYVSFFLHHAEFGFHNREHVYHLKVLGLLKGSLVSQADQREIPGNKRKWRELGLPCLCGVREQRKGRDLHPPANGQVRSRSVDTACPDASPSAEDRGGGLEGLKGGLFPL